MKNLTYLMGADAHGRWWVEVTFPKPLSTTVHGTDNSLARHWPMIRRQARTALINKITEREQKTNETTDAARERVRTSMSSLRVLDQETRTDGKIYGITFGE